MAAKYFSFLPVLFRGKLSDDSRFTEFTWWKLRITSGDADGMRIQWADNTEPPIYYTILQFKRSI